MSVTGRRWTRAVLATALAVALAVAGAPASWADTGSRPHHPRGSGLVALGDSFASGEGTFDYRPGTDTATNQCHRSPWAYGALLGRIPWIGGSRLVACSGAGTRDLLNEGRFDEPAQVDALDRRTRYVTLTVGGNDVGFSLVTAICVRATLARQTCSTNPQALALVNGGLAQLAGLADGGDRVVPIVSVLAEIARRSPRAEITVVGYPELFGSDPADATTLIPGVPESTVCVLDPRTGAAINFADTQWLNAQTRALNRVLKQAVQQSGVRARFVDPTAAFEGHGRCDAKTPWINPLTVIDPTTGDVAPESLHPTRRGQLAYLAAVLR